MNEFIITKKLAKHGKQCVLVIPNYLQNALTPGSIVEVRIKTLEVQPNEFSLSQKTISEVQPNES